MAIPDLKAARSNRQQWSTVKHSTTQLAITVIPASPTMKVLWAAFRMINIRARRQSMMRLLQGQGYGLGEDQPFQDQWEPNIEKTWQTHQRELAFLMAFSSTLQTT